MRRRGNVILGGPPLLTPRIPRDKRKQMATYPSARTIQKFFVRKYANRPGRVCSSTTCGSMAGAAGLPPPLLLSSSAWRTSAAAMTILLSLAKDVISACSLASSPSASVNPFSPLLASYSSRSGACQCRSTGGCAGLGALWARSERKAPKSFTGGGSAVRRRRTAMSRW